MQRAFTLRGMGDIEFLPKSWTHTRRVNDGASLPEQMLPCPSSWNEPKNGSPLWAGPVGLEEMAQALEIWEQMERSLKGADLGCSGLLDEGLG